MVQGYIGKKLSVCFSGQIGKPAVESVRAAFREQRGSFRINLVVTQVCRDIDNSRFTASVHQVNKVVSVKGNNQAVESCCQGIDRRVFETALVKVVADMFDIKPAVEARKALTGRHIFVQQELQFIQLSWHGV